MKMGGCGEGGRGDALRGAIAQQWGDMKSAGGGGGARTKAGQQAKYALNNWKNCIAEAM